MLFYELKTALRHLYRAGSYTILNILGLVIGITLFSLISFLLIYELSFDNFHPNGNKILQVCGKDLKSGERTAYTALPLSLTLKNDFPEVKYAVGLWEMVNKETYIKYEDSEYSGFTGASVEPDLFYIFKYRIILGDVDNVLKTPENIAVSQSMASKIFGKENPVGKTISIRNYSYVISHVFEDLSANSGVKFDLLFSDQIREKINSDYKFAWWNGGLITYVILDDNASIDDFNQNLSSIPEKYYPDFLKGRSTYFTIPFKKAHFDTSILNYNHPAISYTYLMLLGSISFIILLIASINYVNLTLARAFKMNIDAGIRRITGAKPHEIVTRHILFSSLSIVIAFILSIPLCQLCLPLFERLAERPLASQMTNINVWLLMLSALVIVALVSGFIPGRIFSRVNLALIIKSKGSFVRAHKEAHNALLVFQFTLAIALIIAQFFIVKQISFMRNSDLGFDNNDLVTINLTQIEEVYQERYAKCKLYKEILENKGSQYGIYEGTITENIPGYYYQNIFTVQPVDATIEECLATSTAVDDNFAKVFNIDITLGRFFSESYGTDRKAFIINETAMHKIGWKDIEGKYLKLKHEEEAFPVIGVMKDIHITSLKEPIAPMVYRFGQHNSFPAFLTFRIKSDHAEAALTFMKKEWLKILPATPFDHFEVKETYNKNYEEEKRISLIVGIFALLAISLSLFGLLGLIMYYSQRRTKEIGIRKVNGAHILQIIALMNTDLIKWIVLSFVIACPIAWYAVHQWLQNFSYKTTLSWWIFITAGGAVLSVVIITISLQSWRAASRNPVEALRYE